MIATILLIAAIAVAASIVLIGVCREIDRRLRRRQQLHFLRGPLRDELLHSMSRPSKISPVQPDIVVAPVQPIALLTDSKGCV